MVYTPYHIPPKNHTPASSGGNPTPTPQDPIVIALTALQVSIDTLLQAIKGISVGGSGSVTIPAGLAQDTSVQAVTSAISGLPTALSGLTVTTPTGLATITSVTAVKDAVNALPAALDGMNVGVTFPTGLATDTAVNAVETAVNSLSGMPVTVTFPDDTATETKQDLILSGVKELETALSEQQDRFQFCPDCAGLLTKDVNLEEVFGTQRLLNPEDRLKVDPRSQDVTYAGSISGGNRVFQIPCAGFSCLTVQIVGTWTTTITFEGSLDGGTFVTIYGVNVGAVAPVSGTTAASGIFRFAVAGLKTFQVRFSTYASGCPQIIATLSVQSAVTALPGDVYGSVTNALSQKASTNELNTYDTNIVAATMAQAQPAPVTQVSPAIATATSFATPLHARLPQIFQRVRVEVGGSERLPFAQEVNTNRMLTNNPEELRFLEQILFQLQCLNMQQAGMPPPNDWQAYQ